MEIALLVGCVLAPTLLSLASLIFAGWVARRQRTTAASAIVAAGWCVSVTATLLLRQDLRLDFVLGRDFLLGSDSVPAWQRVILPITATAVAWAIASRVQSGGDFRWIVLSIGGVVTAMFAMPGGDGWADMLPRHRTWMALVTAAILTNVWSLERLIDRDASAWTLLVSLGGLAASTLLAASAYGGLAEWLLGAITATAVFAVAIIFSRGAESRFQGVPQCLIVPASIFAAAATASGRFYTYDDNPSWLYGILLFLPTLVAFPDRWIAKSATGWRVGVAGVLVATLLVVVGWTLLGDVLLADPADESW